jgi:hypothetical protein
VKACGRADNLVVHIVVVGPDFLAIWLASKASEKRYLLTSGSGMVDCKHFAGAIGTRLDLYSSGGIVLPYQCCTSRFRTGVLEKQQW